VVDRIAERGDLLLSQADGLRKQLDDIDIDIELDRLTVAERVVARFTRSKTRSSPGLTATGIRTGSTGSPGTRWTRLLDRADTIWPASSRTAAS